MARKTVITPRTAAVLVADAEAFYIEPGKPEKISASGLAGVETVTVYAEVGAGVYVALADTASILTATAPVSSIIAGGSYKLVKTATVAAVGAYVG